MTNPWETPEQVAHAEASDRAWQRRRARQTRVFWLIVASVLTVGLVAVAVSQGWLGVGGNNIAAKPCPTNRYEVPSKVRVNVLNATARSGLAAETAKQLKARGFVVASVGNANPGLTGGAPVLVTFGPDGTKSARSLQLMVKGATTKLDPAKSNTLDFVIGDSFKALQPAAATTSRLKPVPSPSGCAVP